MRRVLFVLAALGAGLALPAAAAPESAITNPSWAKQPSAGDITRVYPEAAYVANVEGRAVIECEVELDETLSHCFVVEEEPAGHGFGAAALQLAPFSRMHPKQVDGKPVRGASVRVPFAWSLQDTSPVDGLEGVDADAVARCFGATFVALDKKIDLPPPIVLTGHIVFFGGIFEMKSDEANVSPLMADKRLRDEIDSARDRQAADAKAFASEVTRCQRFAFDISLAGARTRTIPAPAGSSPGS